VPAQELPAQHGWPFCPQGVQARLRQTDAPLQNEHAAPPPPQPMVSLVPAWHALLAQQPPPHDCASQMQKPPEQRWPDGQGELPAHRPPQPSGSPQFLPAQLGTHPQKPPEQLRPELQLLPPQQGCPLAPHAVQLPARHTRPGPQPRHAAPEVPQAVSAVPPWHWPPPQQPPAHELPSHTHDEPTQRWPLGHDPAHGLEQPSLSPQFLPAQLGMQEPHRPGVTSPQW
jgi:hypothetical protein